MPIASAPKLTPKQIAEELKRLTEQINDRSVSREDYVEAQRQKAFWEKEYQKSSRVAEQAAKDRDRYRERLEKEPRPQDANRARQKKQREARGDVKPEVKPEPPKEMEVGDKRDPKKKPDGKIKAKVFGAQQKVGKVTQRVVNSKAGKVISQVGKVGGKVAGPVLDTAQKGANVIAIGQMVGGIINTGDQAADDNSRHQNAAIRAINEGVDQPTLLSILAGRTSFESEFMRAQFTRVFQILGLLATSQSEMADVLGAIAAANAVISTDTDAIRLKLDAADFPLQNAAALLTRSVLPKNGIFRVDQTGIAKTVKAQVSPLFQGIDSKLPKNGIFRVDQTGIANVVKSRLDPSFQAIDGKLPKNGIFRVDQTGIANVVKSKLDPSFQAIDGKLPKNGIFRVDQTGIANVVKSKLDPSFQAIDGKLPKNGVFRIDQPSLAALIKTTLAPSFQAIKIPTDLARKSDIKTVVIPSDLARKSDIANIRFPAVPTPVVNLPAPIVNLPAPVVNVPATDIGGIVQAVNQNVNQTLNQQTTNITNIVKNTAPGLTQAQLDRAVVTVTNHNTAAATNAANATIATVNNHSSAAANNAAAATITAMNTEMAKQTAEVKAAVSDVKTDVKDVSTVLGVPQLKPGLSVRPDADLKAIGVKTDNGNAPDIAKNLPQLMMLLSAVPYVRQGLHRLGGQFDTSVMNPQKGKSKITDVLGFQQWTFNQIDERLGMPSAHTVLTPGGQTQTKTFRSMEDAIEENNANTVVALQDLEVVERYLFAITQDVQKLMQITLQTREDVDVLIDDAGCKVKEVKKSHPTHINLTNEESGRSLSGIFQPGRVHYLARQWDDSADKNQKLERMSYDTQIAAMSNKFEFDKESPELPLQKARAADKPRNDELWRTYVSTMEEPPEGYITPGNPIPDIKEIRNGNPVDVPKPTNPQKKLGK
jgi:hypothetical protein